MSPCDMPAGQRLTWLDCYRRDGFVILRRAVPKALVLETGDELDALLKTPGDVVSVDNLRCRYKPDLNTGAPRLEAIDPVIDLLECCATVAGHAAVLSAVAAVYGEPGCLFKDKVVLKPPGVPGYGLHQDWIAWPGFPRSFLSVLVPLDRADAGNGCTIAYRGYHRSGSLTPEDGRFHELPSGLVDERHGVPLELDPGDIAIFDGFTPHRSAPNTSDRWRRQLFLSFNSRSDGGCRRDAHYAQFREWLLDRTPADVRTRIYFC